MSAVSPPPSVAYDALDAHHRQIRQHLAELAALAQHIENGGVDAAARSQAGVIEAFFSGTARQHHAQEEKEVFPLLLAGADAELTALVHSLRQDHGWIEENWIELGPLLGAIAAGNSWFEESEFQHGVELFLPLYLGHIELEERRVYPECRARAEQAAAQRKTR